MKSNFLVLITIAAGMVACDKDKFNTKPSLELKNVSSYFIPVNGIMEIEFDYTDKEGDISNIVYIQKIRTNLRPTATTRDSLKLDVPDFPKFKQGVVALSLTYQNHLVSATDPPKTGNPPKAESDSLTLKIVLKDKADNVSDTVVIQNVVIERS